MDDFEPGHKSPETHIIAVAPADVCPPRQSVVLHVCLITSLSMISLLNSFGLGVATIALPQIVHDLNIPPGLIQWPSTANTLAIACCLLPAGAVADIIGSRRVSVTGTLVLTALTVASGMARSPTSFIAFRALAGVGAGLVQSTSVSILTRNIARGRLQNMGFSCLGLSMPFGFAVGLVLGGFFTSTSVGWRLGFYLCGGCLGLLFLTTLFALPNDDQQSASLWRRVLLEIDWIGALLLVLAFILLSYGFSLLTTDLRNVSKPPAIATLCIGTTLLPILVLWTLSQNARGRPALLPREVLNNPEFILLCCIVFCTWAASYGIEWFVSIYFQVIQHLTPSQAAVRLLPELVFGIFIEIVTGAFIHRLPVVPTLILTCLISSVSPLLMALIDPSWSYWRAIFWAMLLLPVSIDVLFTTAVLLITDIFPLEMHGIAGAVFNVACQTGTAGGISILALIASGVSQHQSGSSQSVTRHTSTNGIDYTQSGVVDVFWACFGLSILAVVLVPAGLWKRTYVGQKEATDSNSETMESSLERTKGSSETMRSSSGTMRSSSGTMRSSSETTESNSKDQ